jgi:predicted kinase
MEDPMTTLTLMRGYPGSGKTTLAKAWVAGPPTTDTPRARVSRDDLRATLFASEGVLTYAQEQHITAIEQDQVRKLLKRGYDVVVDDLNLRRRYAVDWAAIALEQQAKFEVWDVLTDLTTCLARDGARARKVGPDAIRDLAAKFPVSRWPSPDDIMGGARERDQVAAGNWVVYDNPKSLPRIVLVDLDGTVALKDRADGARGWHEYDRVGEDLPNWPVIEMVNLIHEAKHAEVVFMSGRKDYCREQTRMWLGRNVGKWTFDCELFMRADEDNREDSIVKHELFDKYIRGKAHVVGAFDDRDRVVAMWRAIGLQVYQVAPGNF